MIGHVPVIGSGFDSVMSQIGNWANFNKSVEENNLARLAASEQNQNAYYNRVAELARQDAEQDWRDRRQDQIFARDDANIRREDARYKQHRTDVLGQQSLENAFRNKALDMKRADYEMQQGAADRAAEFSADDIETAGRQAEASRAAHDKAQRELDTAISSATSNLPSGAGAYNGKTKRFEINTMGFKDPEEKAKAEAAIAAANAAIETARADYNTAVNAYSIDANAFDTLQKQMSQYGLLLGKRDGRWTLINSMTGKKFTSKLPPLARPSPFATYNDTVRDRMTGTIPPMSAPASPLGFAPPTQTVTQPMTKSPLAMKLQAASEMAGTNAPVAPPMPVTPPSPLAMFPPQQADAAWSSALSKIRTNTAPILVTNDAEYDAVEGGQLYIDLQGNVRRKKKDSGQTTQPATNSPVLLQSPDEDEFYNTRIGKGSF